MSYNRRTRKNAPHCTAQNASTHQKETGGKDNRMFPAPHVTVGVTTAKSVSWKVGLDCRFLSMFGERGPTASDPVPHLGSLLLHECHHLLQIRYSFFRRKFLDMHLVDFDFDFS